MTVTQISTLLFGPTPGGVAKKNQQQKKKPPLSRCRNSDPRDVAAQGEVSLLDQPLQSPHCLSRSDVPLGEPLRATSRHTLPLLSAGAMWKRM